jgi:two-component system response regulator ResD
MVVDDDPDSREALAGLLDQSGYLVEVVGDGARALFRLERRTPDLLVTDLQMPGMSGLELIRRVHLRRPELPVILVTGGETRGLCTGAPGYGAAECLTKPLAPEELLWAIERTLACRRAAVTSSLSASL